MIRILAADGMEKGAVKALEEKGCEVVQQFYEVEDLKQAVKEFDALVVRSATKVRVPVIDEAAAAVRQNDKSQFFEKITRKNRTNVL